MFHYKPVPLTKIPELQPRKCVVCGSKFKTMKQSKVITCSKLCATDGLDSLNKRKALLY